MLYDLAPEATHCCFIIFYWPHTGLIQCGRGCQGRESQDMGSLGPSWRLATIHG